MPAAPYNRARLSRDIRDSDVSLFIRTAVFVGVLINARPLLAQEPAAQTPAAADAGNWVPLGLTPVDQAGAGRRGYVLAGESADVTQPGSQQLSIHAVAANNFYREQGNGFSITQRLETHTLAFGYRRGFKLRSWPRFEVGGQLQLTEGDEGFLNGFISGTENLVARLSGRQSARNLWRSAELMPPLGMSVTRDGQSVYQATQYRSGFGDFSIVGKALVRDGSPASDRTRVAIHAGINISGRSAFAAGNFVGFGISVDKKVVSRLAVHADLRATYFIDRVSPWNLPLKRESLAFSAGPELRLVGRSSMIIQMDGNASPYLPTGAAAFDHGYGDVTFGFNHPFNRSQHQLIAQVYMRENLNLPFRVRWNADPDLALGIKFTLHALPR